MINATIYKHADSKIIGFHISGHAGYAASGSDIVCSAVSALAITAVNSVERFCSERFRLHTDAENGDMEFRFEDIPGHDASLIMNVFETGVTEVGASYGEFICITFKEVE